MFTEQVSCGPFNRFYLLSKLILGASSVLTLNMYPKDLQCLPPIPPSIRVFSNESTLCMKWPKYWSFSFSIIPSNEHPGLISFRMDWLDSQESSLLRSLRDFQESSPAPQFKSMNFSALSFLYGPTVISVHDGVL